MINPNKPLTVGELITLLQDYPSYTPVFIESNFATEVYDVHATLFEDAVSGPGQHQIYPVDSPLPLPDTIPGKTTYGVRIAGRFVDEIRTQRIENYANLHRTYPDINPDSYN